MSQLKLTVFLASFLLFNLGADAQSSREKEIAKFEKEYQKRIKKERLFGVYIPKDIADSFSQLNRLTTQDARQVFKHAPEDLAVKRLHFSLGRWMIHNWGFYGGSRLSHHIKGLGITHPDQQAKLIIRSYHRYLNKKPLAMEQQLETILAAQKKEAEERRKKATIISSQKRKRVN